MILFQARPLVLEIPYIRTPNVLVDVGKDKRDGHFGTFGKIIGLAGNLTREVLGSNSRGKRTSCEPKARNPLNPDPLTLKPSTVCKRATFSTPRHPEEPGYEGARI